MVNKCCAFIALAIRVTISPHNYIAVSISIYIACRCYGITQIGICKVAFHRSCCGSINTACAAMVHKYCAFTGLAIIVKMSPHNYIAVSIAIYIACRCYGNTHTGIYLVAFHSSRSGGINTACTAMVHKSPSFKELAIRVTISPHNYIAVSIAIYIACRCYGNTHICICLVAFYRSRCGDINTGCAAMVHKGTAFIGLAIIIIRRSHDNITVSIAIYITSGGNVITHICIYLVAFYYSCRRGANGVDGYRVNSICCIYLYAIFSFFIFLKSSNQRFVVSIPNFQVFII